LIEIINVLLKTLVQLNEKQQVVEEDESVPAIHNIQADQSIPNLPIKNEVISPNEIRHSQSLSSVESEIDTIQVIESAKETKELKVEQLPVPEEKTVSPYGLPSIRESLRFLISLVNPEDNHNSENMRLLGLSLLSNIIENFGVLLLKFPRLFALIEQELFKHLFQLLKAINSETHNAAALLQSVLRCINSAFIHPSLRIELKEHLEFYVQAVIEKLSGVDTTKWKGLELQELAFQYLLQLVRLPNFLIDLYVNFDCNLQFSNLFETLVKLSMKNMFPEPHLNGHLLHVHILSTEFFIFLLDQLSEVKFKCKTYSD
jgi:hypothetical protein